MKRAAADDAADDDDAAKRPATSSDAAVTCKQYDASGASTEVPLSSDPPPDATSLRAAQFFYYDGGGDNVQGPFGIGEMRAWFEFGYLTPGLHVAPSWYGEVPSTLWPIAAIWPDEATRADEAFACAPEAAAVPAVQRVEPDFIECPSFSGGKDGYVFRTDLYGTGYYKDTPKEIEVTAASILDEKEEKRKKALEWASHIAPTGADFREHKG